MNISTFLKKFMLLITLCTANFAYAESGSIKPFSAGSYQNLLAGHAKQPFMLVLWSLTCPSCIKDMTLLKELHQKWPALKLVMIATDELSESAQVKAMLTKTGLTDVENWIYADDNTQKLNYEIDPEWYGEQPRTYFFDAAHQRKGVSGVITKADYESLFTNMLKLEAAKP